MECLSELASSNPVSSAREVARRVPPTCGDDFGSFGFHIRPPAANCVDYMQRRSGVLGIPTPVCAGIKRNYLNYSAPKVPNQEKIATNKNLHTVNKKSSTIN